ncbi:D-aminoacyl-tRNA deacylase [candidate division CSSED10-310 bacterium]|uniref:D-aminoacyl-tRNA deacylase n=1 Tax=candidate division CSSED10-310 bacterium TaxID=2855610 RepID=A0ABV6Z2R8_UNCC1
MIAVVQRVTQSSVTVDKKVIASIGPGLLVLLGIKKGDQTKQASWLADKIVNLRIFRDAQGKLNKSILDNGGEILVVSQFTLLGDCRKGRRPSYFLAAEPQEAIPLYQHFNDRLRSQNILVREGIFGAMMDVALINDGPVTLIVETP